MKKLLALTFSIFSAMSMNAQEICAFNPDNELGLDGSNDGTTLTAGTIIGETSSIVATIGDNDTFRPQDVRAIVNGYEIRGGLQGSTNPKDEDGGKPSDTLKTPTSGWFLKFQAKADGWLYVIFLASSHKAYTVFEDGKAIGYNFSALGDASTFLGAVYQFTIAGAGRYNLLSEAGIDKVEPAELEYLKYTDPFEYDSRKPMYDSSSLNALKVIGTGIIWFKVYKGCEYILNSNGSKIVPGGFVFSTVENVEITSGGTPIVAAGSGFNPLPRCANPEITVIDGKIKFICETEGASFISEIKANDAQKYHDSEISLSHTYTVTVYAYKSNYLPSDKVTHDIVIKGDGKAIIIGDVNNDGKVNVADHVKLSSIILNQK